MLLVKLFLRKNPASLWRHFPNTLTAASLGFNFSNYESSFKDRAAGKAQLKEFYKFTHPDFFGGAPDSIR